MVAWQSNQAGSPCSHLLVEPDHLGRLYALQPESCTDDICSCLSLIVPKIPIPVSSDKQGCSHLLPLKQIACFIFHGKESLPCPSLAFSH